VQAATWLSQTVRPIPLFCQAALVAIEVTAAAARGNAALSFDVVWAGAPARAARVGKSVFLWSELLKPGFFGVEVESEDSEDLRVAREAEADTAGIMTIELSFVEAKN
jgi:hypothetical protein